ncbi:PucR family transcriptional regulator [Streptomyces sp. 4N509B]|uniref:PucR family transcriptional regulator n=1 Tax=Streptomyces sp. 4N509B TaxID=3457413 RepID=UPI003FD67784
MPPTLASLARHSALRLRVLTGEDRLAAPVRWAHASELADPVPYLDGGELLLTTALKLPVDDAEAMDAYVKRLVEAGVVGLGFGVGIHHPEVPPALLAAAREAGLPLLLVPRRTPFIAISKVVSASLAAEQYRAVTAGFAAQRELTRAALSPDGQRALLARLAAQVDGWVALYDLTGAVTAAAPAWAARRAARFASEVRRLRDHPSPASSVCGEPGEHGTAEERSGGEGTERRPGDRVELQPLGTGQAPRAVLAIGTAAPLGTAERYAVEAAVAVLTLTTERFRAVHAAESRLGAAVLRMLLAGEADHARAVAGQLYGGLLDAPLRLVVAEAVGDAGALEGLAEAVEAAAARAGESVLAAPDGELLVLVVPDGGAAVAACATHVGGHGARRVDARSAGRAAGRRAGGEPAQPGERAGSAGAGGPAGSAAGAGGAGGAAPPGGGSAAGLAVGMSAPTGPAAVGAAYRQAREALAVAHRRGRALVEHDDVTTGSVVELLADDAVRAFADGTLRALREHDAHGRGDLVASLRAWLSHHGQWDAAAAELGVHRHTLRYRMRRVEEILDRALDDPDVRMELWLALKATSPGT